MPKITKLRLHEIATQGHSFFVQWAPKDASFCNRVHFGRSRSFKVDDFGINRMRVCDFQLVGHCDYGPILHHFSDMATYWLKIAYFSYPSLIQRPRSISSLWNFSRKLTTRKLESPVKTTQL